MSKPEESFISVKNFEKFQHYKERCPPWIKIHRSIFEDYEFECLQDSSKLHLVLIWVLASQCDNKIRADPQWIKRKIGVKGPVDIQVLVDKGFLLMEGGCVQDASKMHTNADSEAEAYKPTETYKSTEAEKVAMEAIEYLNSVCGKKYTPVKDNLKPLLARQKEGYGLDDFKKVVVNMASHWKGCSKMNRMLRPSTLFQGNPKFEGYLNSAPMEEEAPKTQAGENLKTIKRWREKYGDRGVSNGSKHAVNERPADNGEGAVGGLVPTVVPEVETW
jgi:uncharacterized phage protein (TIGR02220 family)